MQLVIVADIFGHTRYLAQFFQEIADKFSSTEIVDPYEHDEIDFKDEAEAYAYFQRTIGLNGYIEKLNDKLLGREKCEQLLLGFSVGATAIWAISDRLAAYKRTKGICFYSSQIRNYLNVSPKIHVDFYFAANEKTYDVDEIMRRISILPNVNCIKTEYLHGFMNKKSQNFEASGYSEYLKILETL